MSTEQDLPIDLLWGAEEIGKFIGRTPMQTSYMLESGVLPAKKIGSYWVAERGALARFFMETEK
jgi:hypothetical protein